MSDHLCDQCKVNQANVYATDPRLEHSDEMLWWCEECYQDALDTDELNGSPKGFQHD